MVVLVFTGDDQGGRKSSPELQGFQNFGFNCTEIRAAAAEKVCTFGISTSRRSPIYICLGFEVGEKMRYFIIFGFN